MPMQPVVVEVTVRGGENGRRALQMEFKIAENGQPGFVLTDVQAAKLRNRMERLAALVDEVGSDL